MAIFQFVCVSVLFDQLNELFHFIFSKEGPVGSLQYERVETTALLSAHPPSWKAARLFPAAQTFAQEELGCLWLSLPQEKFPLRLGETESTAAWYLTENGFPAGRQS